MPRRDRISKSAWSVFLRIEELVLASSGADAFEIAYALVVARLFAERFPSLRVSGTSERARLEALLRRAHREWPELCVERTLSIPDETLTAIQDLLGRAGLGGDAEGVDALFEQLVTRVGKGHKGQFFTPRHVVDFAIDALALRDGERLLDPACGSGAFAFHARARAKVAARGFDIDLRAVRVAKLLALLTGADPRHFQRMDSLSAAAMSRVSLTDVIATNPPFAGVPNAEGFEVARLGGATTERDALFLERCVSWLDPGGRLAIVLPHGRVASKGSRQLRTWLVQRMRVFAVVSLPQETFLPHTSQRTALLFAKKRAPGERPDMKERVLFAVSERAGTDSSGEPLFVRGTRASSASFRDRDHDLGSIARPLHAFLAREGFTQGAGANHPKTLGESHAIRTLGELGPSLTLAPERYPSAPRSRGVTLSEVVTEVRGRLRLAQNEEALVLDTTHVKEGVIDVPAPRKLVTAKTRVPGDALLVSRLRPYLRQIALVNSSVLASTDARDLPIACSTELSVLVSKDGDSIAYLLPFLLSSDVQARLTRGQEGGHRPRVPRETLMSLRVPSATLRRRKVTSAAVERALAELYAAKARWRKTLGRVGQPS